MKNMMNYTKMTVSRFNATILMKSIHVKKKLMDNTGEGYIDTAVFS